MNIGIFGGLGYIGSSLVELLEPEHKVYIGDNVTHDGVDRDWFDSIHRKENIHFDFMDIRNKKDRERFIDKCDQIVNLSALVGENACRNDEKGTHDINYKSAVEISDYCNLHGKPMIFLSTCSNYGISKEWCNENSPLNPLTLYSKSKVSAEIEILETNPTAIILRSSTVFGVSNSRTRMDIIPNQFVKEAIKTNRISIYQPEAIRPIIHVKDLAHIIKLFLMDETPEFQVYNVGYEDMNLTKQEMATMICKLTGASIVDTESTDVRTYRVDFSRLHKKFVLLKRYNLEKGLNHLLTEIKSKNLPLNCANI